MEIWPNEKGAKYMTIGTDERVFERMLLTHYYCYYHNNRIFPQEISKRKATKIQFSTD